MFASVTKFMAAAAAATALLIAPAHAEITDSQANGFEVRVTAEIAAAPAKVWKDFAALGKWWSPQHSYSHDAKNLSLQLRAGGCWCEKLPAGGSVEHMRVVQVHPGAEVVLEGAMGPLQTTGADGHMSVKFEDAAGKTKVTFAYDVGGYSKGGMETWAAPVDGVLQEQLGRLKKYSETGAPD
jgi:uncharacterized protein YndB with AHSA1/START domain